MQSRPDNLSGHTHTRYPSEETHMTITVYSKDPKKCVQCGATHRHLDARKIDAETLMIEEQPLDVIEKFRALGHLQAPVVTVTEGDEIIDIWHGFRPDKLDEYGQKQQALAVA